MFKFYILENRRIIMIEKFFEFQETHTKFKNIIAF